ncbi:MAG: hypothetical protein L0229_31850, partial [Blastocatellia bacterium]|nr:hypothetical protein [Blastocatellia bacterium]
MSGYGGFYHRLLSNASRFQEFGDYLVREAEAACDFRQIDRLEELASLLSGFPMKEYRLIGQYYQGWCAYRRGEDARYIFEEVIEESKTYKARALLSLAAVEARKGDFVSEGCHYIEAMKRADSLTTIIKASRGIAVIKAMEGFHQHALKDLEAMAPSVRYASPDAYYAYLNSLAVELGEVGRKHEARNISEIVVASPLIKAYPEWQETAEELRARNNSFIALDSMRFRAGDNVEFMPESDHYFSDGPAESKRKTRPAKVFSLQGWKKKMGRNSNDTSKPDDASKEEPAPRELSNRDMLLRILSLVSEKGLTNKQYATILET